MLKQRREAAVMIAGRLKAAEAATELAMIAAADLNATMLTERSRANLSIMVGQDAIDSAAAAYAAFAQGMRHVIEAHRCLREAQKQVGLEKLAPNELGFGDIFDCPDDPMVIATEIREPLRVVA